MSTLATLRKYEAVQKSHDEAFDKAFALRREVERLLRLKRYQASKQAK